jgi:hypothetical protein
MADDPQECMLLEFDKLLENGQFDVRNEQITSIGADCGLTEEQTYRMFRRLIRDGKIVGNLITISEPPGFAGAWIEDVRL